MSTGLVCAVLFGALLHASWNALIKGGSDKALDTALLHGIGCCIGVVLVLVVGLPPWSVWPWVAVSVVIHVGYYITLVGAYEHGDLGATYPIMRGSAPLLVALASGHLIGETLSAATWLGVLGISGGVLTIGLARSGDALTAAGSAARRRALGYALANAGIIAGYTIVDGLGVRASGDPLAYVAVLFAIEGIPYLLLVLHRRRQAMAQTLAYMKRRAPIATLGALASLGSYGIALWAMTRAPVATVAALRETSVLFAALIGVFMLHERFHIERAIGTGAIVAGVLALRLG